MELIEARKQACQEFEYEFEKVFRRGRPSDDVVAAKKKMEKRIAELLKPGIPGNVLRDALVDCVKTGGSTESQIVLNKTRRIASPEIKPLHDCTFDVDLATVPMKYFDKYVPVFLKKSKT